MRMVLSAEGEAMNRPQGDQAMRPMGAVWPRQTQRSRMPGTTSWPTSMKSSDFRSFGFFLRLRLAMAISLCRT